MYKNDKLEEYFIRTKISEFLKQSMRDFMLLHKLSLIGLKIEMPIVYHHSKKQTSSSIVI